jgi:hypothetical protein
MVAPWGVDEGQPAERAPSRVAPEAPQACSRWLSEATPPVEGPFSSPSSHPGEVQASGPDTRSAPRIAFTCLSDERPHPFRVRISWAQAPVVRADARPPATGLSASGARESRTKRRDWERRGVEMVGEEAIRSHDPQTDRWESRTPKQAPGPLIGSFLFASIEPSGAVLRLFGASTFLGFFPSPG